MESGDLLRNSPAFARFWNDHAVLARQGSARAFKHPQDGMLQYEQITMISATHPDHKVVMLLPNQPQSPAMRYICAARRC